MLGRMARPRFFVLSMLGLMACDGTPVSVPKPPPLPPLPALGARTSVEPRPAEPSAEPEPAKEIPDMREPPPARAAKRAAQEDKAKPALAKAPAARRDPLPPSAPTRPAATSSPTPAPPSQQPQIIATTPKPALASKVNVPKTVHVAIDVPAGLQADLDRDPRMQPWVNQVVATIDRCYGSESKSNTQLAGTIEVLVTMHENERPDADIKQLPPALSPIVACATGGLMRTKMPLFTGKEGSRYAVRLRFSR
jgi:hypothetical protein